MRRILGRIVHNWPLKLAAIGLATLMYGGLALSQNTETFTSPIPVRVINQPDNTVLLTQPEHVTLIRYFAPSDVPVGPSTFRAFIDLDGVPPTGQPISVHIEVDSPDGRIRVLSYEPAFATIQLDALTTNEVPVKVEHGAAPAGLELGPVTVSPTTVTISGAASLVRQVVFARADVLIDPTGLDVDQEVELIPIDGGGVAVRPVEVTPATARVTIPVFTNRTSKSLPVNPVVTGTPAAGFEIATDSVAPQIVLHDRDAGQGRHQADPDRWAVVGRDRERGTRPAQRRHPGRHGDDRRHDQAPAGDRDAGVHGRDQSRRRPQRPDLRRRRPERDPDRGWLTRRPRPVVRFDHRGPARRHDARTRDFRRTGQRRPARRGHARLGQSAERARDDHRPGRAVRIPGGGRVIGALGRSIALGRLTTWPDCSARTASAVSPTST